MRKGIVMAMLAVGIIWGQTPDPEGFHFWSHSNIEEMSAALSPQMDAHKFKSQTIASAGNHRFLLVHREGPGQSEYHSTESDIIFIQTGEGTLIYGGKMIGATTTAPNEMRGSGIEGGTERKVAPGDVIAIPAKLPHQMKTSVGSTLNYFVVKVTE